MRNRLRKRPERPSKQEIIEHIEAAKRYQAWYHTIDLGEDIKTPGIIDHSEYVHLYGFPEDLAGKRVIDIGTANGFFAFELERRSAEEVVAVDIHPPEVFNFVKRVLGSNVRYIQSSIYDLNPRKLGTFDLVFCGDLLMHLDDIVGAVRMIRYLTRDIAIIASALFTQSDESIPLAFAPLKTAKAIGVKGPGRGVESAFSVTWIGNLAFYSRLLEYVGFSRVEIVSIHVMETREDHDIDIDIRDGLSKVVIRGEI